MVEHEKPMNIKLSFEFFPPKTEEMDLQLWKAVDELANWQPEFLSVTYGAGGTTRETTLSTMRRMIGERQLSAASHLTCVGASKAFAPWKAARKLLPSGAMKPTP